MSSSKGSDGHTLAFTTEGEVFSWGDGDYGKLGHGNSSTQKYPKLIQGPLQGKVWLFQKHTSFCSARLRCCVKFEIYKILRFCVLFKFSFKSRSISAKHLNLLIAFGHVISAVALLVNFLTFLNLAYLFVLNCSNIPGEHCFC